MQARSNFYITYCVLLSITFVCSCCLLFVVAAENFALPSPLPPSQQYINVHDAIKDVTTTDSETTSSSRTVALSSSVTTPEESQKLEEDALKQLSLSDTSVTTSADVIIADSDETLPDDTADTASEPVVMVHENEVVINTSDQPQNPELAATNISGHKNKYNHLAHDSNSATGDMFAETSGSGEPYDIKYHQLGDGDGVKGNDNNDETVGQTAQLHALPASLNPDNGSLADLRELMPEMIVSEMPPQALDSAATSLHTPPSVALGNDAYENDSLTPSTPTLDIQSESTGEPTHKDEQREQLNGLNGKDAIKTIEVSNPDDGGETIPDLNSTHTLPAINNVSANGIGQQQRNDSDEIAAATASGADVEEVPMPVFSEWAQKQMEEQQAMEQKVYNTNAYKKNLTNDGNGKKVQPLKIRAKNYASPDCGAKIIASNTDATNTGAVLSSSKDEYMLSPCGNRIWFVVELCEAIQARKIDVANFELFSSSPRNFTVAVSNRFPTRDWSNVGRFIAADKRTIQSFELHPHLFGKFIRVDIHSHYSKEHFCPVSLFRVFGTSEFEAFETENHPTGGDDDLDDEFDEDHNDHTRKAESNLFKSASDAVLSIVKKAAEVLAKPVVAEYNNTMNDQQANAKRICGTPVFAYFSCTTCAQALVDKVNRILSCELPLLMHLLNIPQIRNDLLQTRVCSERFGLDMRSSTDCSVRRKPEVESHRSFSGMDIKRSYFLNLLSAEHIGGLCQLLYTDQHYVQHQTTNVDVDPVRSVDLNLTIDKKALTNGAFKVNERSIENDGNIEFTPPPIEKQLQPPLVDTKLTGDDVLPPKMSGTLTNDEIVGSGERVHEEKQQTTTIDLPVHEVNDIINGAIVDATTTLPPTEPMPSHTETPKKETAPDINIFNAPPVDEEMESDEDVGVASSSSHEEKQVSESTTIGTEETNVVVEGSAVDPTDSGVLLDALKAKIVNKAETDDEEKWANLDQFLVPTTAQPNIVGDGNNNYNNGNGGNSGGGSHSGSNQQQKIVSPTGAQSESVFIRLSNRIKALERNMSLSGQYLEELSRRYKKQVEELQQTLTQQTQTVRLLEEQGRQHVELERLLAQRNAQLKDELDDLTLQVHACIVLIIFVGVFVFIVLMIGILFYRAMRRETKDVIGALAKRVHGDKRRPLASATVGDVTKAKVSRRKSFEDLSSEQLRHQSSPVNSKKQRRPSEEAMLILKDYIDTELQVGLDNIGGEMTVIEPNATFAGNGATKSNNSKAPNTSDKRRSKKHSWPQTAEQRQQQQRHMTAWQLQAESQQYDRFIRTEAASTRKWTGQQEQLQSHTTTHSQTQNENQKKKRKSNYLKRQESAPSKYPATFSDDRLNVSASVMMCDNMPLLDEEDINNFIPNADLAYNEFMPDGPFNYKLETSVNKNNNEMSRARRLTSVIFRTPFAKNLKTKSAPSSTTKQTPPHESTSWEWHRLNRNGSHLPEANKMLTNNSLHTLVLPSAAHHHQQQPQQQQKQQHGGISPAASIDSASLSEINFPNNCTENSFRMLEEAIISSGENAGMFSTATTSGTKGFNSSGSGTGSASGSSNRSSTSSTSVNAAKTKKTYRSFNRIFRKVF